jgi:hypothetical protein
MSLQSGSRPSSRKRTLESIRSIVDDALRNAEEQIHSLEDCLRQQDQKLEVLQGEIARLETENAAYKSAVYALTGDQRVELTQEFLRDVREHGIPMEQVIAELEKM